MGELPPGATETSRRLLVIPGTLADLCPLELGQEIALMGSVSRGWADEHSDIEMNFWVEKLDWPAACETWLRDIGATEVRFYPDPLDDAPRWVDFDFNGTPVEIGWQIFEECDAQLDRIIAGRLTESDIAEGLVTEALQNSIALRDGVHLRKWNLRLRDYPDALRSVLITRAAAMWSRDPRWFNLTAAFARRPEPSALVLRYDASIRAVLRILFALNRQWEPELRKWMLRWVETLEIKPDALADRILEIYEHPLAGQSLPAVLYLVNDTLRLVPVDVDVSQSAAVIKVAVERYARS
jgi:Domain of unknown function (DUF4037)